MPRGVLIIYGVAVWDAISRRSVSAAVSRAESRESSAESQITVLSPCLRAPCSPLPASDLYGCLYQGRWPNSTTIFGQADEAVSSQCQLSARLDWLTADN